MSTPPSGRDQREVLFEMNWMGRTVRVSAIDARTNIEVTIVGDARAGEEALKRAAMRKLDYVLRRRGSGA